MPEQPDFDQIATRISMLERERQRRSVDPMPHVNWRGVVAVEKRDRAATILTLDCGHHESWPDFADPPTATLCATCYPPRGHSPTIADELRLIWNARGAADLALIDTTMTYAYGSPNAGLLKTLDRALRSLDR